MEVDQWLRDVIPIGVTFIAMIAWFIRLESKVLSNEKSVIECERLSEKLDVQLRALDNKIVEKLSFIERSLAKIEGRLSLNNDNHQTGG